MNTLFFKNCETYSIPGTDSPFVGGIPIWVSFCWCSFCYRPHILVLVNLLGILHPRSEVALSERGPCHRESYTPWLHKHQTDGFHPANASLIWKSTRGMRKAITLNLHSHPYICQPCLLSARGNRVRCSEDLCFALLPKSTAPFAVRSQSVCTVEAFRWGSWQITWFAKSSLWK